VLSQNGRVISTVHARSRWTDGRKCGAIITTWRSLKAWKGNKHMQAGNTKDATTDWRTDWCCRRTAKQTENVYFQPGRRMLSLHMHGSGPQELCILEKNDHCLSSITVQVYMDLSSCQERKHHLDSGVLHFMGPPSRSVCRLLSATTDRHSLNSFKQKWKSF